MKRYGKKTVAVRQDNLDAVVKAITTGRGKIHGQNIRFSRKRRHGVSKTRVVTVLTYSGGELVNQKPAVFKPY
jgi:hypothetical protein